jgi:hypothetical protein
MRKTIAFVLIAAVFGVFVGGAAVWGFQKYRIFHPYNAAETRHPTKDETDEALAVYTLYLMLFTGLLAVATIGLGAATAGLYLTGEKQVALTKETLIAEQRAWIVTSLEIGPGGLQVTKGEMLLDARLKVSNVGRTPAIGAHTDTRLMEEVSQEQIQAFAQANKKASPHGLFVSPNDFYYRPWLPSLEERDQYKLGAGRGVSPILTGCVTYSILQDQNIRQIAFAYLIGLRDGSSWGGEFELKDGKYSPEQIIVTP